MTSHPSIEDIEKSRIALAYGLKTLVTVKRISERAGGIPLVAGLKRTFEKVIDEAIKDTGLWLEDLQTPSDRFPIREDFDRYYRRELFLEANLGRERTSEAELGLVERTRDALALLKERPISEIPVDTVNWLVACYEQACRHANNSYDSLTRTN